MERIQVTACGKESAALLCVMYVKLHLIQATADSKIPLRMNTGLEQRPLKCLNALHISTIWLFFGHC